MNSPLALQLYTVRDAWEADPGETLARVAAIGYGAVEPYDILSDPTGLRDLLDRHGLAICSTHAPVLAERQDEIFAAAAVVGVDTIIAPGITAEHWTGPAAVRTIADRLNAAARAAAGHGLRIGYHNHFWELELIIDGRPALEALAEWTDPEVILELDVYWAAAAGVDVPDLLGRLGDKVRYLHVKDGPADKVGPWTAVGAGRVDIPPILDAAKAAEWWAVELDECATDLFDALAESHTYLTEYRGN
ncbi:TIM barrel protein [Kribbella solani]|uniref:Sugar phosphate isomerase/epimerase n=1 Tax=Kribbella solani TaxID=236067 RepID=A0A841DJ94_9ACTN|nr:sugar phosphate isomerase/epimerase [Kribbella solani]